MKNVHTLLLQLGLSEKEAAIYTTLLHRGASSASSLAEHLGFPRSTVKFLLDQMLKKTIITQNDDEEITTYAVEDVGHLSNLVSHEKALLAKRETLYTQVLGDLKKIHNPSSILPKIKFYEGVTNTFTLMYDFLSNEEDELRIFGAAPHIEKFAPQEMLQYLEFSKSSQKKTRVFKGAAWKNEKTRIRTSLEVQFYDYFQDPSVEIQITGNKVCMLTFEEGKISGLKIEHEEIAHGFAQIFDELWYQLSHKQ